MDFISYPNTYRLPDVGLKKLYYLLRQAACRRFSSFNRHWDTFRSRMIETRTIKTNCFIYAPEVLSLIIIIGSVLVMVECTCYSHDTIATLNRFQSYKRVQNGGLIISKFRYIFQ